MHHTRQSFPLTPYLYLVSAKFRKLRNYLFITQVLYKTWLSLDKNSVAIKRSLSKQVKQKPIETLALTMFVGYVIGNLIKRR